MDKKRTGLLYGAFVGDALALGAHWIYDPKQIKAIFGVIDQYIDPVPGGYHSGKTKGDFTHYGDQMLVLLETMAEAKGFDLDVFSSRWRQLFDGYSGYVDQATKLTLANFSSGKGPESAGSSSDDLAGAARIAPLVYSYGEDLSMLIISCIAQTAMTHNNPLVLNAAEFFARVCFYVLKGDIPSSAIKAAVSEDYAITELRQWVERGLDSIKDETIATVMEFGQSCHTQEAFPCVIHLICKYERDFKEALIQSVMAGGDSAGRNMLVGMVLGAYLSIDSIPKQWLQGLNKRELIDMYLRALS